MNSNTNNSSDNNNSTSTSRNPSHTEQYRNLVNLISARIQANQANIPPLPLSSSLPSSMASSLSNTTNTASAAATAQVHAMQQIQQQQHQLLADKMDTSGPMSSTSTAVFVGDVISKLYPNVNQQETPLPRQWSVVHKQNTLKLTLGNLRVTYTGKLTVYAIGSRRVGVYGLMQNQI